MCQVAGETDQCRPGIGSRAVGVAGIGSEVPEQIEGATMDRPVAFTCGDMAGVGRRQRRLECLDVTVTCSEVDQRHLGFGVAEDVRLAPTPVATQLDESLACRVDPELQLDLEPAEELVEHRSHRLGVEQVADPHLDESDQRAIRQPRGTARPRRGLERVLQEGLGVVAGILDLEIAGEQPDQGVGDHRRSRRSVAASATKASICFLTDSSVSVTIFAPRCRTPSTRPTVAGPPDVARPRPGNGQAVDSRRPIIARSSSRSWVSLAAGTGREK